jgi:hypothetical protein
MGNFENECYLESYGLKIIGKELKKNTGILICMSMTNIDSNNRYVLKCIIQLARKEKKRGSFIGTESNL